MNRIVLETGKTYRMIFSRENEFTLKVVSIVGDIINGNIINAGHASDATDDCIMRIEDTEGNVIWTRR